MEIDLSRIVAVHDSSNNWKTELWRLRLWLLFVNAVEQRLRWRWKLARFAARLSTEYCCLIHRYRSSSIWNGMRKTRARNCEGP